MLSKLPATIIGQVIKFFQHSKRKILLFNRILVASIFCPIQSQLIFWRKETFSAAGIRPRGSSNDSVMEAILKRIYWKDHTLFDNIGPPFKKWDILGISSTKSRVVLIIKHHRKSTKINVELNKRSLRPVPPPCTKELNGYTFVTSFTLVCATWQRTIL